MVCLLAISTMASASSKAIPFVAVGVALILVFVELSTGKDVNLEALVPLLTGLGIGGIPLSIVKNAIEAKKAVDIEKLKVLTVEEPEPEPTG